MPKLLRWRHPSFLVGYQGAIVAALGVGTASAIADPTATQPMILKSFYNWVPINTWGWIYLAVGAILIIGLMYHQAARFGLGVLLLLLTMRLGFQIQQSISLWHDGATAKELLPTVAGLPILYAFISSVLSMAIEPFSNVNFANKLVDFDDKHKDLD